MMDMIYKPWPWYIVGPLISITMLSLIFFGKTFGVSSNLRTLCAIGGADKFSDFFKFDWKAQIWNLVFILGTVIGAAISHFFLSTSDTVPISSQTILELKQLGINNPGAHLVPSDIFSWNGLLTMRGMIMIVIGGMLVGFGTRYAGGCTSGHAITGLSELQLPSLIAVIGFFIGGLTCTYLILPTLLTL